MENRPLTMQGRQHRRAPASQRGSHDSRRLSRSASASSAAESSNSPPAERKTALGQKGTVPGQRGAAVVLPKLLQPFALAAHELLTAPDRTARHGPLSARGHSDSVLSGVSGGGGAAAPTMSFRRTRLSRPRRLNPGPTHPLWVVH